MNRQQHTTWAQDNLEPLLLVAAGAVPGALIRWQAATQLATQLGTWLPGGISGANVLVNSLGSFLLGVVVGQPRPRRRLYLVVGVGFCGALTTFSSWVLVAAQLQQQKPVAGLLFLLISLGLGLAMARAGLQLGSNRSHP